MLIQTAVVRALPLFALSAALESATHVLLKKGADTNSEREGLGYYLDLLADRNVWLGVGVFLLESVIWVAILARLPLGVAFPLTGLQKLFLVAFTVAVLREPVAPRERLGLAIVFCGLLLIAFSGGGG